MSSSYEQANSGYCKLSLPGREMPPSMMHMVDNWDFLHFLGTFPANKILFNNKLIELIIDFSLKL